MKKILVLASGRGTDFQAILDHERLGVLQRVRLEGLVCNHEGAVVVGRAKNSSVRVFEIKGVAGRTFADKEGKELARQEFDSECLALVNKLGIDLVVLAGFDQIVSSKFVEELPFKIINIHPALDVRRFGGKNMVGLKVHEAVLKSGAKYSGCTVHFVTKDLDLGPPILRKKTRIIQGDTPESLERRILAMEHLAFPEAIQLISDERVYVNEHGKCFVDRLSDNWDIEWASRQQLYLDFQPEEAALVKDEIS